MTDLHTRSAIKYKLEIFEKFSISARNCDDKQRILRRSDTYAPHSKTDVGG